MAPSAGEDEEADLIQPLRKFCLQDVSARDEQLLAIRRMIRACREQIDDSRAYVDAVRVHSFCQVL